MRIADAHRGDAKRFIVHADEKPDGVFGTRKGCLHPPIERTMLATIAAQGSGSLCELMKS
jgi:hypothetical protein